MIAGVGDPAVIRAFSRPVAARKYESVTTLATDRPSLPAGRAKGVGA
jgi:hypothetical protein